MSPWLLWSRQGLMLCPGPAQASPQGWAVRIPLFWMKCGVIAG